MPDPMPCVREGAARGTDPCCAFIDIQVQPRASRDRIGPVHGDRLKIAITAPPVDGAANAAVVALLAKRLAVPRRAIEITSGQTGRRKTVRVAGLSADQVRDRLALE